MCSKEGQVTVKQNNVMKRGKNIPVLIASMTTGIIKIALLWSEHRTRARQTTTPSAIIY
jgi:hypothetical protein